MLDAKHKISHIRGMNKLPPEKRAQVLAMLCEGSSMQSIARVLNVSYKTILKLLKDAGEACVAYHYETVRNVASKRVQCDEIWSFCYAKQKNVAKAKAAPAGAGNVWTWTALDANSKMILSWMVGDRGAETANYFMDDLASRLANPVQLTTDGHHVYLDAVAGAFGNQIDYAMLIKLYGDDPASAGPERKYSPNECVGARKEPVTGNPDMRHVSTSYVEDEPDDADGHAPVHPADKRFQPQDRQPHLRAVAVLRFLQFHPDAQRAPHVACDGGWCRGSALVDGRIVALIDARAPKPGKRGPYKKRATDSTP